MRDLARPPESTAVRDINRAHVFDSTWMAEAACRDVPAATAQAMASATSPEALELLAWRCEACPVAWECLGEGLRALGSGIYGGFLLDRGRERAA